MRRTLIGSLVIATMLSFGSVGSAVAGDPGSGAPTLVKSLEVDVKETCKTVLVLASTTPTVTVTIKGKPTTIDAGAFASASVKICVRANVDAVITVNVNADPTDPLCPIGGIVTGNIHVGADANVSVTIDGLDYNGKPMTSNTGDLVGPVSGDVPFEIVVCDP